MLTIPQTVDLEADAAHHKVDLTHRPGVFLVRTMLAGAYIGIGVLIMVTAGGPLVQAASPWAPLIQGLVFGVALTIVVVAGGELATSAMMILTQGVFRRSVRPGRAALTLLAVFVGNLVGATVFAALLRGSGVLAPTTAAGKTIAAMIEHKAAETTGQLFVRGILCNLLVCLAIWCAGRLENEGAKITVIFACVMVFITSGFEHVVANMTTFSFGLIAGLPHATVGEFARNLLAVGLGNLVGGGLLVGASYAYGVHGPRGAASDAKPGAVEPTSGAPAVADPELDEQLAQVAAVR
ncbi:formate/nitrite transporter family protein [Cellulomonas sp. NTE-D12]|uniref:formate/nitrite transporter family protein n=1 Tax=Cellulomonas sp. NTE-D12 TaxID=2962632 RepID=UPI0030818AA3|nr:nitrite transporter NirC [Cellulomonas sp. NTE-D12]